MSLPFYNILLPQIKSKYYYQTLNYENPKLGLVSNTNHLSCRRAVYKLAYFFKREFSYDFIQYSDHGEDGLEKCQAFIWTKPDYADNYVVIGACCFRLREYKNYKSCWGLQWIWFHPYARNNGLLSKSWPFFEERFRIDFHVEPPLSKAMNGFLQTRNFEAHTKGIPNNIIELE